MQRPSYAPHDYLVRLMDALIEPGAPGHSISPTFFPAVIQPRAHDIARRMILLQTAPATQVLRELGLPLSAEFVLVIQSLQEELELQKGSA
jgi:hypothetical protein